MNFSDYQKESRKTAMYPDKDHNFVYPTLGISGKSGEVAEKVKKILRDKEGKVDEEDKKEIAKELGDVLWYIAQLSSELGLDLDDVARGNIEKLRSRKERGVVHGNGDNR